MYYKPIKVTIDAAGLAEVIIDMVTQHHGLPNSIVSDCRAIFTSKFSFSFCYFLDIKQQLSTMFYPQTDKQIEQQNSIIEAYFCAFVNWEQNN